MKYLMIVLLTAGMLAGCGHAGKEQEAQKAKPRRTDQNSQPSEKEQIESEVREGGLKDPGGAKALRQESQDQQKEQQDQADQAGQ